MQFSIKIEKRRVFQCLACAREKYTRIAIAEFLTIAALAFVHGVISNYGQASSNSSWIALLSYPVPVEDISSAWLTFPLRIKIVEYPRTSHKSSGHRQLVLKSSWKYFFKNPRSLNYSEIDVALKVSPSTSLISGFFQWGTALLSDFLLCSIVGSQKRPSPTIDGEWLHSVLIYPLVQSS